MDYKKNIKGELIGYARVSSAGQNTARQEQILKECGVDTLYIEKISGKDTNRPQLQKMMEYVRKGDAVIVEDISRFGRSLKDLIDLVERLNEKEVQFISIKENFDTTTPNGKLVFNIFASLAEFERETIKERQKEGIELAKLRGVYKGKPKKKYDKYKFIELYQRLQRKEITRTYMREQLDMSASTLYRTIKEYESNKDK